MVNAIIMIHPACLLVLYACISFPPLTMGDRGEELAAAAQQQPLPGQAQPQLRIAGLPPWMLSHLNA
jgi:MADS-box transcription factor, plant